MYKRFFIVLFAVLFGFFQVTVFANENQEGHGSEAQTEAGQEEGEHAAGDQEEGYDPVGTVMEHISDANNIHIWKGIHLPLPCILLAKEAGLSVFMSSVFEHGHTAVDGYVLNHGRVNRVVQGQNFPMEGEVHIDGVVHRTETVQTEEETEEEEVYYVVYKGEEFRLDPPGTLDRVLRGDVWTFFDFSITKVVFSMMVAGLLLVWLFFAVARGYKRNEGKAPSGVQSFMEPFFTFLRDEVTIPMIGEKHYERFQPFIMTLFFFVLFCNLLGLVPFFPGSANINGNVAVTATLAAFTFIVTNINGNAHYWKHVLWMPGIPAWVKIILTPVEILSLFIKPFSLTIRLFANITAGHIIILSLIGLIFLFGDNGENIGGAALGGVIGGLFTAFMNLIELLVAFLQAFIFAILSASYIGQAVEESHMGEAEDHEEETASQAGAAV
jgi:F-type H+-transporting ATPase subunit a